MLSCLSHLLHFADSLILQLQIHSMNLYVCFIIIYVSFCVGLLERLSNGLCRKRAALITISNITCFRLLPIIHPTVLHNIFHACNSSTNFSLLTRSGHFPYSNPLLLLIIPYLSFFSRLDFLIQFYSLISYLFAFTSPLFFIALR